MSSAETLNLRGAGTAISAQTWGPQDGIPLLALHGWLDNSNSFLPLAAHLPGVRLVAVDLPGHGCSEHRASDASYSLAEYLLDVLQVMDELGWQRCQLLGHSMGGAIAALLAVAAPERVIAVTSIEALGPLSGSDEHAPEQMRKAIRARRAARGPARIYADIAHAVAARRAVAEIGEAAARLLMERSLLQVDTGWRWRSDPRLRLPTAIRLCETQVCALLRAISCPFRLISADPPMPYIDQAQYRARLQCIADLRHTSLPGTHHLHMEQPEQVAALIAEFVATNA